MILCNSSHPQTNIIKFLEEHAVMHFLCRRDFCRLTLIHTNSNLKMSNEGGWSRRDEASLGQDARLHVAKLQTGVVAYHLT